ncbi:MAG: indolepyruvate ferredoxin oxidoreductase subunit alpha [Coriobacteriales bacterium]|jgi:indolepyruvate ferredoxin oxidoreductase alpha subunit
MTRKLLMGNEAFGLGAIASGVNIVCGYPGTPSTEVLETVAKNNPDQKIHVEWSTNEKAALEVAAGASYCGARSLITMKQMGLNVASDPLMSLCYVGVKGGVVLLVADDPGPISSQTEQDTRRYGSFSKVPVLDPTSPQEAYQIMPFAFDLSEKYGTPVIVRSTTRVSHGGGVVDVKEGYEPHAIDGFERSPRWVIFPKRAFEAHNEILERLPKIAEDYSNSGLNTIELFDFGDPGDENDEPAAQMTVGIAAGGVSYAYVREVLERARDFGIYCEGLSVKLLKVETPYPFPERVAVEFLDGLDHAICFEELDPVIEDGLSAVCGSYHFDVHVSGKHDGYARAAGENSVDSIAEELAAYLQGPCGLDCISGPDSQGGIDDVKYNLPPRPPVLCSGCPHRGAFFAVKRVCSGRKAYFSGDIGCYTLGNAMPLDMVDNCLCMGAGITMAQGMKIADPDAVSFAFIGDSTFFASGITGVVNSVYNGNDVKVMVLDNSTTAMTGHQPHPGTGIRMSERPTGMRTDPVSIEAILKAIGVSPVITCDPNNLDEAMDAVTKVVDAPGTSAVIFKSPCAAIIRTGKSSSINPDKCTRCRKCIKEIGCPAISVLDDEVVIDRSLCNGCGLCTYVCPFGAIEVGEAK